MDPLLYKDFHENFMKNHNGTTIDEVLVTIIPTYFTTFLAVNLILVAQPLNTLATFLIEFVFIVFSTILHVTVLNYRIKEIALILVAITITAACKQIPRRFHYRPFIQIPCNRPEYLNIFRAHINLITAVCILAVDFKCFPRKLAKTETFGFGLMDIGVGQFVFGNGIVAPEIKRTPDAAKLSWRTIERTLWSCVPLVVLGAVRFAATNELDYQQHVSEYGVHWNFFLTLAVTKFIGSIIIGLVSDMRHLKIISIALLILHEIILQSGAAAYVIDPEQKIERDGLFNANREGICSILGYVSLYLVSVYIGFVLKPESAEANAAPPPYTNVRSVLWRVVFLGIGSLAMWKITYALKHLFGVSRRLANCGYVFWSLSLGTTFTALFMLMECFCHFLTFDRPADSRENEEDVPPPEPNLRIRPYSPIILSAISYNGLAFFLIANVMTGIVNLTMQTLLQDTLTSVLILTAYALILCSIVTLLYLKRIKLKIW